MKVLAGTLISTLCCTSMAAQCPLFELGTPITPEVEVPDTAAYQAALTKLDVAALKTDLMALMTASKECWPADDGHYGGLMIRLAWHCSGTYREFDKKGGCHGARIRFLPESNWMDNANLDKARAILAPIKEKYGDGLSWGDLITFAGVVAVRSMNGPTLAQCFGRIDEPNGKNSDIFGTTEDWSTSTRCTVQGKCTEAEGLGATTVGLIYVNPEGPLNDAGGQDPDPAKSAIEIREVFGRMGMNDSETAALIAGGHAFGKCHSGTSGFEGPWTTSPAQWTIQYINGMLDEEWEKTTNGENGPVQWQTKDRASALASTMRLTADLALVTDLAYKTLLTEWAATPAKLDHAFSTAWDKLLTSGKSDQTWSSAKFCEGDGSQRFSSMWLVYVVSLAVFWRQA